MVYCGYFCLGLVVCCGFGRLVGLGWWFGVWVWVVGSVVGRVVSRFGVLTCRLCVWWVLVISGLCVLTGWCFLCGIVQHRF